MFASLKGRCQHRRTNMAARWDRFVMFVFQHKHWHSGVFSGGYGPCHLWSAGRTFHQLGKLRKAAFTPAQHCWQHKLGNKSYEC
jgi:hypothetical protein